jgi:hypothetical protein
VAANPKAVDLRLDLQLKSGDTPVTYEGRVEIAPEAYPLEVTVTETVDTADGLHATAEGPALPETLRERVERLAASIARKAVRAARKDGLRPPRRLRRWRSIRG